MRSRFAIVTTLGCTQALAWASSYYIPGVLAVPMAHDTGVSPPWIYAALSMGLGVSAVLGPTLGHAIDTGGGRPVICASNLAFAAGLTLLSLANGPVSLIFSWLVLGIAMGAGLYEAAFAAMTRLYGIESRSAITGITLLAGFSSTVGWPASAVLEHAFGWRGACAAWALIHLLVGLPLNAWALRYGTGGAEETPLIAATGRAAAEPAIRPPTEPVDRSMVLLGLMFTASGMVTIGMATNLPRLFVAIGAAPAGAIAAASLLGPAQVAARILEFSARHRINPLISARVATALHPLAAVIALLGGVPAVIAFSIIHGCGSGMLTICRGTLPLALYGPDGYGARIGRISAPARIAQAVAPFLFGLAIEKVGAATLWVSSALSVVALLSLSGIVLPRTAAGLRRTGP